MQALRVASRVRGAALRGGDTAATPRALPRPSSRKADLSLLHCDIVHAKMELAGGYTQAILMLNSTGRSEWCLCSGVV